MDEHTNQYVYEKRDARVSQASDYSKKRFKFTHVLLLAILFIGSLVAISNFDTITGQTIADLNESVDIQCEKCSIDDLTALSTAASETNPKPDTPLLTMKNSRQEAILGNVRVSRSARSVQSGIYDVVLEPQRMSIQKIELYDAFLTSEENDVIGIDDVQETGELARFKEVYAINPTSLNFSSGIVTALAKGTVLHKCKEWDFASQSCLGEWVKLMDIVPGEEYSFILTADDPGFAESITTCVAEDLVASNAWSTACDGVYPSAACGAGADLLRCNDGLTEIHQASNANAFGGVRFVQRNSSIADCQSIQSVSLCIEWWGATGLSPVNCTIAVSNQNGTNFTAVNTTCPGVSANPGIVCQNVTASKSWTCANFFGSGNNDSQAYAELQRTVGGNKDIEWDVFFFNVSYSSQSLGSSSPANQTVEIGSDASIRWQLNGTGGTYTVTRNGTVFDGPRSWTSGQDIVITPNTFFLGLWNYTLHFNDTSGSNSTSSTTLSVIDSIVPSCSEISGSAGSVTTANITINGVLTDWDGVLTNPNNFVTDLTLLQGDPDVPGTSDRDMTKFAYTYDNTNLYFYFGRLAFGRNQISAIVYVDKNLDAAMSATDRVAKFVWSGSTRNYDSDVYNYLPANTSDPMLGDGFDMPGGIALNTTVESGITGGSLAGTELEGRIPWSSLGFSGPSPLNFKAAVGQGSGTNLPTQLQDNVGGVLVASSSFLLFRPDQAKAVRNGTTVFYAHDLMNCGNNQTVVQLMNSSTQTWNATFFYPFANESIITDSDANGRPNLNLGADNFTTLIVRLNVPVSATTGTVDTRNITAASSGDNKTVTDITTVSSDIAISPKNQSANGSAGLSVSFNFTVYNFQAFSDILNVNTTSANNWTITVLFANGTLLTDTNSDGSIDTGSMTFGDSKNIIVRIQVPGGTSIGTNDTTTIRLNSSVNSAIFTNATMTTTILDRLILVQNYTTSVTAGTRNYFQLNVTNNGNQSDAIDFSFNQIEGWNATFVNDDFVALTDTDGDTVVDVGSLAPFGGKSTLYVRIDVPNNVTLSDNEFTRVFANSSVDSAISRNITINTTPRGVSVFNDSARTTLSESFEIFSTIYARSFNLQGISSIFFVWFDGVNQTRTSANISVDVNGTVDDELATNISHNLGTWTIFVYDSSDNSLVTSRTFNVVDLIYPQVTAISPAVNSSFSAASTIEIAANVTDNYAIENVTANITFPNGTIYVVNLTNLSGSYFNASFVIPSIAGTYNVTFIANDTFGNVNNTAQTNFTVTGLSALAISINQTTYLQGTAATAEENPDFGIKFYIPFQVRFFDVLTNSSISTGTCSVVSNNTAITTALTFNASTGNYTGSLDTFREFANTSFTATCSDASYSNATNSTSANIIWLNYLIETRNILFGGDGSNISNSTTWLSKDEPNTSTVLNRSFEVALSPNATNVSLADFFFCGSNTDVNCSFLRVYTFLGNAALRLNLSVSQNDTCDPQLCFHILNTNLENIFESCGNSTASTSPSVIEQNVSINGATIDQNNFLALSVRCSASPLLLSNTTINVTLFYNYSDEPASIEVFHAQPSQITATQIAFRQSEPNYTMGPQSTLNITINHTAQLNNSLNTSLFLRYFNVLETLSQYKPSVINNTVRVYNSTGQLWATDNASLGAPELVTVLTDDVIVYDTEVVPPFTIVNETAEVRHKDALRDDELLAVNTTGLKRWDISVFTIFTANVRIENVTVFTDYSAYIPGNDSDFVFFVAITNSTGTFNITNESVVNRTAKTITFPKQTFLSANFTVIAQDVSAPNVTNITTSPASPITNNQSEQNISVNFTSSEFPINVTFILYNSTGAVIVVQGPTQINSSGQLPINFTIPANLSIGTYVLNMTVNDSNGNSIETHVANITVIDITPPLVFDVRPSANSTFNTSDTIEISANVTDNVQVGVVQANITFPNGTSQLINLTITTGNKYNSSFSIPNLTGQYNITFIANDTSGNINGSTTSFFVASDFRAPNITNVTTSPGSPITNNQSVQNVTVNFTSDEFPINVTFILYNSTGSVIVVQGPTQVNSSSDLPINFTIPANLNIGNYTLNMTVNDSNGNNVEVHVANITVIDITPPLVFDVRPAQNSSFNTSDTIEISANVTDNVQVSTVRANITFPNGTSQIINLTLAAGNKYNASFTVPNLTGQYNITFIANDTSGNLNNTQTTFFVSADGEPPQVIDLQPMNGTNFATNQNITLSANVTDNIGIGSVFVNVSFPNGTFQLIQLFLENGTKYSANFTTPELNGTYTFRILANDTTGNSNNTETGFFDVTDISAPLVFDVRPSANSTFNTSQTIEIAANVTDNIGVNSVRANITFPNGTSMIVNLSLAVGNKYNASFAVPQVTGQYNITFIANDTDNNVNATVTTFFVAIDVSAPNVTNITTSPASPITNNQSEQNVSVNFTSSEFPINVTFILYNSTGSVIVVQGPTQVNSSSDLPINFTIPANLSIGNYTLNMTVNDSNGNNVEVHVANITVVDIMPPLIFDPRPNATFNKSQTIEISVNVTDNVAVDKVVANITFPNGTTQIINLSFAAGSKYNASFLIPNLSGQYNVTFIANDTSGNVNDTQTSFNVSENAPPNITNVTTSPQSPIINNQSEENVSVNFTSSEFPINITFILYNSSGNVTVVQGPTQVNSSSDLPINFTIPANLTPGNYTLNMTINDSAGNSNVTHVANITVIGGVPIINATTSPYDPIVGQNVSLNGTANGVPVLVNITLPNGTIIVLPSPTAYTVVIPGRHNITYWVNGTLGVVPVIDLFFAGTLRRNITFNVVNSTLNGIESNLTVFLASTNTRIDLQIFNGTTTEEISDIVYDLFYTQFGGALLTRLNSINLSIFDNDTLGVDLTSVEDFLITYGFNSTYNFTSAELVISYAGSGYTNEDLLSIVKCANWNFTTRTCEGTWSSHAAVQNKSADTFTIQTNAFSAFSVQQGASAGSGRSGGGGGGGGAGGQAKTYSMSAGNFTTPYLGKLDKVIIRTPEQEFSLIMLESSVLPVWFRTKDPLQEFAIYPGQTIDVDLNADGLRDLKVTLLGVEKAKASLLLELTKSDSAGFFTNKNSADDVKATNVLNRETPAGALNKDIGEMVGRALDRKTSDQENGFGSGWSSLIVLAVILFIAYYLAYNRKKDEKVSTRHRARTFRLAGSVMTTVALRVKDRVLFTVNDVRTELHIERVAKNCATFSVSGKQLRLMPKRWAFIDADNDGKDDMTVKVKQIADGMVIIELRKLDKPIARKTLNALAITIITLAAGFLATVENPTGLSVAAGQVQGNLGSITAGLWEIASSELLALVAIMGLIGLFIRARRKKGSNKKDVDLLAIKKDLARVDKRLRQWQENAARTRTRRK